jgi:ATP-binding cassette, subfamily B, bacterial
VEFRDVSFTYPLSKPPSAEPRRRPPWMQGEGSARPRGPREVLKGVSFTLPAGKTVALVGANGAGKTTIVKLLSRLYDPTGGQILLDGTDLRELDLEDLRRQVAVVFQDYARFQLPARDNIGFGQVDRLADMERITRAASQGGAVPVIERLPEQYETTLGRMFSGGVELSGGEWQKVALARGFMRESPQLLVLDEPTAALDAQAEFEVYERFRDLTEGRTTLLISHRFSTVRMADHIVVLEDGHIVEQGPYDALIAAAGTYARLYELQAQRYR